MDVQEDHVLPAGVEGSARVVDSGMGRRAISVTGKEAIRNFEMATTEYECV